MMEGVQKSETKTNVYNLDKNFTSGIDPPCGGPEVQYLATASGGRKLTDSN